MLKKTFIITILTTFIISSVFIIPKERASANPLALLGGAGAYSLVALGGAAVLYGLGATGAADELAASGEKVWNKTSSALRDGITKAISWGKNNLGVQEYKIDYSKMTATEKDLLVKESTKVAANFNADIQRKTYESTAEEADTPSDSDYEPAKSKYLEDMYKYAYAGGHTYQLGWEANSNVVFMWTVLKSGAKFEQVFFSYGAYFENGYLTAKNLATLSSDGSVYQSTSSTSILSGTGDLQLGLGVSTAEQLVQRINYLYDDVMVQVVPVDVVQNYPNTKTKVQEQWETMKDAGLVVSGKDITVANPDYTFNPDGTITDGAGATVGTGDIALPKPGIIDDRLVIPGVDAGTGTDVITGDTVGTTNPPTTGDGDGILQGLWDWLKGILQAILDAIKAIASALGVLGLLESIVNFLSNIWSGLQSILGALSPLEILQGILSKIGEILSYLNPFSENFFLWIALVPSAGFFSAYWSEIYNAWLDKIPIVGQLFAFLDSVKDSTIGQKIPEFKITLPSDMGGKTMPIVNFGYFTDYRNIIVNFIRFTAWFIFIKRIWAKLPRVVY